MNCGVLNVDFEALSRALGIPERHKIEMIKPRTASDVSKQQIRLVISGPTLPEQDITHPGYCGLRVVLKNGKFE